MVEQNHPYENSGILNVKLVTKQVTEYGQKVIGKGIGKALNLSLNETLLFGLQLAIWKAKDDNYQAVHQFNHPQTDALSNMRLLGFLGRSIKKSSNRKLEETTQLIKDLELVKLVLLEQHQYDEFFKARQHTIQLAANSATPFFFEIRDHNGETVLQNDTKNLTEWTERWSRQLDEATVHNLGNS